MNTGFHTGIWAGSVACIVVAAMLLVPGRTAYAEPAPRDELAALVEGTGVYSRPIDTSSPRAQAFFDQGLRLTWGYYFPEAAASFQEALRLDPGNPVIHWGLTLAISPNPNCRYLGFPDDPQGKGWEAIEAAHSRAAAAPEKDRAFIEALFVRYDAGTRPDREARDRAYLDAARALARRYPRDPDAVSL